MKANRLAWGAAIAFILFSSDALAGGSVPPDPTLTVTTAFSGDFLFRHETISFSGSDYCGPAYYAVNFSPVASVTCGHTVYVGLWEPAPYGGGFWGDSVTVQSTPGGITTSPESDGQISGSLTVYCGQPDAVLYVYDLAEGTVITSISVPSFACTHIIFHEK
jgi:hypothetical protein